jgi:CubicO group peptidase (beta-lactamase class C family)
MKKLTFLFLMFIPLVFWAQMDSLRMSTFISRMETYDKMWLTTCFMKNGEIVYQQSSGYIDYAEKRKANVYSQYRIGSISKTFTAVMVLQLMEEGKLKPDSRLSQFYASLPNSQEITMMHLLKHRSGLHNFTANPGYPAIMEKPVSDEALIALFEKDASDFKPGSKMEYSNTNYVLLSMIIEQVTKNTYQKELLKRICAKAGLADTRVGTPIDPSYNQALSYDFNGKWVLATQTDPSIPKGAGAIVSTAKDLCLFVSALMHGKLMKKESLDMMRTLEDGMGCGIFELPFYDRKAMGHNGSIDGFRSMMAYFPDDSVSFCVLSNAVNDKLNTAVLGLLKLYYGKPFDIPTYEQATRSPEVMRAYAGKYRNEKVGMFIEIKKDNDQLFAQAEGQAMIPLTKISAETYEFKAAGIVIEFIKEGNGDIPAFILKQNGVELSFLKQ